MFGHDREDKKKVNIMALLIVAGWTILMIAVIRMVVKAGEIESNLSGHQRERAGIDLSRELGE